MEGIKDDIISWIKSYTRELYAYTISKIQQKEVAEEIVQDTFISAFQGYQNFHWKSSAKTWLFSILKHKIADYYRIKYKKSIEVPFDITSQFFNENKRWKQEYKPIDWKDETDLLDDPEFAKALKNCFDHLPEKWSVVMRLKFLEEHNADGICNQLEITKSNFWQIIHRAKLQLRNCLELKWFKK